MNEDLRSGFWRSGKMTVRAIPNNGKSILRLPFFAFLFFITCCSNDLFSQDCSGVKTGGFILTNNGIKCAPALGPATVNISIGGVNDLDNPLNVQIQIDWKDGTTQVLSTTNGNLFWGGVGSGSYSNPALTHVFPATAGGGAIVQCEYVPVATLYVAGTMCSTVGNPPTILRWNTDDQNSGMLNLSETVTGATVYNVCAGTATTVTFTDRTTLNCIPNAETANPNEAERWRQFDYGTTNTITGAVLIGGVAQPFPFLGTVLNNAPAPTTALPPPVTTSSITIPATATVGQEFDITMYYWNTCNPYSVGTGTANAVSTVAKIIIVSSPQPDFDTKLGSASGPVQSVFCIGDNIFFNDLTPPIGGASFGYNWQFFDNNTGTGAPLSTSTSSAPIFAYATGGQKLIRLTITDTNAAGSCVNSYDGLITVTPTLLAKIQTTDLSNNPITPYFCQNSAAPLNTFQVRFIDASTGTASATTQWQWQFYDQNNVLVQQVPASGFSSVVLGPFDQSFTNYGIYKAILIVSDVATGCQTRDTAQVRIYDNPVPLFTAPRTCQGQTNAFTESSTLNSINGESIVLREWDFNYNGTFTADPAFTNQTSFTRSMGAASTYQVALRVTTNQNSCSAILVLPVIVDPLPLASFTADVTSGCSILTANFTNTSILSQPDVIDRYVWEIDANQGLGFQPVATQTPSAPGFSNLFTTQFRNTGIVNTQEFVRLHVYTVHGCETISSPVTITIFPGTASGFIEANYSPFNDNCSPQSVTFNVDAQTQSLNPSNYNWTVSNANGIVSSSSTGTTPSFTFNFTNITQSIEDFSVKLTTSLSSGCFGDSVRTIRISPIPISMFTIDTLQFGCQVVVVNLIATQPGLPFYHWVVNENGSVVSDVSGSANQFQYSFNRVSSDINVQLSLDTRNLANCSSAVTSSSIVVSELNNITASFTVSPSSQIFPSSTVTITNTSTPGPWNYLWNFGDGTTSTDPGVSGHTYSTDSVYTISLTVSNSVCTQTQTQQVTILPRPPLVDFSYVPGSGCQPLTVQFTNLTQFADPSTYMWNFGDGGTSKAPNPAYTYFNTGTYSVSLTASNSAGQTITVTKSSIIDVYVTPVASFKVTPPVVYIPGGILYTANLSTGATSFLWDFGDGGTSTDFRPEHVYKTDGTFTITLTVTNESGCSDSSRLINAVTAKNANQVLIPNAFTPGNDSKNDVFLPLMRGVTQFEMLIFNRWGQLLFETHDQSTGWDGYYKGRLCEQDVYMYKLSVLLDNGETLVRVGDVNLIR
jgi:gliding motility-associated-like protein